MSLVHPPRIGASSLILLPLILLAPLSVQAATYYVAPTGSDTAAGTEAAPFATVTQGQRVAVAGDTVFIRGGVYTFSGTSGTVGVLFNKSGQANLPINYFAFPGETPIFDLFGLLPQARVTGLDVNCSWIHIRGLEVRGVQQIIVGDSWAVRVRGNNNVLESLNVHHNEAPGFFITSGGNNLVLNCDSHHNYDPLESGGNADGFGCHIPAGGTGNVFRGCRAWANSDDGWDLINAAEAVTIEDSWSWSNGYQPDTTTAAGNGSGFKSGGYGLPATGVPANPPVHVVRRCLAFMNRAPGFDVNHHPVAVRFYNNTSYGNRPNFDLLGVASDGTSGLNIGVLRNNIAFSGTLLANNTGASVDDAFNSWTANIGATITATDFQSVAVTGMDGPRQADGGLPIVTNFHLAAGSDLIDRGTDLGLPFVGSAPDLGAFEFGATGSTGAGTGGGTGSGGVGPGTGTGGRGGVAGGTGGRAGSGGAPGMGGSGLPGTGGTGMLGTGGVGAPGTGGTVGPGGTGGARPTATGGSSAGGAPTAGVSGGCACNTAGDTGARVGAVLFGFLMLATWLRRKRA
jgi:hypothetical protein